MSFKLLYDEEWVSARPLLNQRFQVDDPACEICRRASCAKSWISVKRRVVRCRRCFTPATLDDKGTVINAKRLIMGQRGSLDLYDPEDARELLERIQPLIDSVRDLGCHNRLVGEVNRELGVSAKGK